MRPGRFPTAAPRSGAGLEPDDVGERESDFVPIHWLCRLAELLRFVLVTFLAAAVTVGLGTILLLAIWASYQLSKLSPYAISH